MSIEFIAEFEYNPDLLGQELDEKAGRFSYVSYAEFLEKQTEHIEEPFKKSPPFFRNRKKRIAYNQTYNNLNNSEYYEYKLQKRKQALLKAYPSTLSGYAEFLAKNEKTVLPFLNGRCLIPVSEEHRRLHTYITGGTGSGKSEAIKSFIWHYLTKNKSTAIVLLSPHAEICEQVAKFNTHITDDRLVYINPDLHPYKFPCFNPFDIPNKRNMSDREAENRAEDFRQVFEELLQNIFTDQMNALLQATIPIMFKMENTSIYNLLELLEPQGENVQKYIDFANANFKNKNMLDFLNGKFLYDDTYNRTKSSMVSRLHLIFGTSLMQSFLVGKSTIKLEELINQRKVIVFNISKGTAKKEWLVMGKIIIAMIKNIAFNRENQDPNTFSPCHLFIDECQNYITESIKVMLRETRKHKLYLTLAQQTAGAEMTTELFKAVLSNTGIKLTGRNGDHTTLKKMSESTGANLEELSKELSTGRFSLWRTALVGEKQKPPIIVTMPTCTVDNTQAMTETQWETVKKAQIKAFYISNGTNAPQEKQKPLKRKIKAFDNSINEFLN